MAIIYQDKFISFPDKSILFCSLLTYQDLEGDSVTLQYIKEVISIVNGIMKTAQWLKGLNFENTN